MSMKKVLNKKEIKKKVIDLINNNKVLTARIMIGVLALLILIGFSFFSFNDNKAPERIEVPESKEAPKYETRSEANQMNGKKSSQILNDFFEGEIWAVEKEKKESSVATSFPADNSNPTVATVEDTPVSGNEDKKKANERLSKAQNNLKQELVKTPPKKRENPPVAKEEIKEVYVVQEEIPKKKNIEKSIKTKILNKGTFRSGSILSFVLLESFEIGETKIKKGQIISGVCQERDRRLFVSFSTMKVKGEIIPVHVRIFGGDGLEGLAVAGGKIKPTTTEKKGGKILTNAIKNIPLAGGILGSVSSDVINEITSPSDESQEIEITDTVYCTAIFSQTI